MNDEFSDKSVKAALMELVKQGKLRTYKKKGVQYWIDAKIPEVLEKKP